MFTIGDDDALMLGDDDEMGDDSLILGDDILLGDDELILGGRRAPRAQGKRKVKLQRIQPVAQTQVCSFPQGPNGGTQFAASQTGTLSARPQRVFQTERLAVPSTVSPYFVIRDLVIGRDSMLVNSEATSAEIFSQVGVGVGLRGFIARPGIDININLSNIDSVNPRAFYGSIIGPTLV